MTDKIRMLWVVEGMIDGEWQSTVYVGISRSVAREEASEWRSLNCDPCRVRAYVPREEKP